jgi:hypothetical protein
MIEENKIGTELDSHTFINQRNENSNIRGVGSTVQTLQ